MNGRRGFSDSLNAILEIAAQGRYHAFLENDLECRGINRSTLFSELKIYAKGIVKRIWETNIDLNNKVSKSVSPDM